mgnify:FL=1
MNVFHRAAEIASESDSPIWYCLMLTGETRPTLSHLLPPFSFCENREHRVTFLLLLAAMRDTGDL